MTDDRNAEAIPLPLDYEQLADILETQFHEVRLGEEREDGYQLIDCSVDCDGKALGFDDDIAVTISLIVDPGSAIVSLTFFSLVRDDVDLVAMLKYLRTLFARGPQYNVAFVDHQVTGISFDYDLRVTTETSIAALFDTLSWFAKYVARWHDRMNPHLIDMDEDNYWSAENDDDEYDDAHDNEYDEIEIDDDEIDDDDDGDGRYVYDDVIIDL